jgi:hypothetical protein
MKYIFVILFLFSTTVGFGQVTAPCNVSANIVQRDDIKQDTTNPNHLIMNMMNSYDMEILYNDGDSVYFPTSMNKDIYLFDKPKKSINIIYN